MKNLCTCLPILICLAGCSTNPATSASSDEHPKVIQCKKAVDLILTGVIKEGMIQEEIRQLLGDPQSASSSHWYWVGVLPQPPYVSFSNGRVSGFLSGSAARCLQADNWG